MVSELVSVVISYCYQPPGLSQAPLLCIHEAPVLFS